MTHGPPRCPRPSGRYSGRTVAVSAGAPLLGRAGCSSAPSGGDRWRAGSDGEVYAYLPTSQDHGTSLGRGRWRFPANRWVAIEQRVKLNTPGASDGEVAVWHHGRQVFVQRGMTYRTTDQLKIDGLFFSTFFGGGDESWASPVDQYADFAGFSWSQNLAPSAWGGPRADPQAPPNDDAHHCQANSTPAPS